MNVNRYCLLTSGVPAAIAVIEFQGSHAAEWIREHWSPSFAVRASSGHFELSAPSASRAELKQNSIRFGLFSASGLSASNDSHSIAGEAVVLCRTGSDCYELHCHGGLAAANIIVQCLKDAGFEPDNRRGFGDSPEESAIDYQAIEDLQRSVSIETASLLMDQSRGALSKAVRNLMVLINKGDTNGAVDSVRELIRWAELGTHLVEPWKIVLAGPPNSGKSSLLNAILGYQRAIVHEQAGTTRDLLTEHTSVGGWPVVIVDSAGVRETEDRIEGAGIAASFVAVGSANCLLLLVSPELGWQAEHNAILSGYRGDRVIVVETKSDLGSVKGLSVNYPSIATSVAEPQSIERLLHAVERALVPHIPPSGTAIPFRREHVEAFQAVQEYLSDGKTAESLEVLKDILSGASSQEIPY